MFCPEPSIDRCHEPEGAEPKRLIVQNAANPDHGFKKKDREKGPGEKPARPERLESCTYPECRESQDCCERREGHMGNERDNSAPPSSLFQALRYDDCVKPNGEGLLYYQKFWYLSEVEISIRGELLHGTTLEFHENTIRLVNKKHSYYIPLHKVDYIRTSDGLETSFTDGRFGPISPLRVDASPKSKIRRD